VAVAGRLPDRVEVEAAPGLPEVEVEAAVVAREGIDNI